MFVHSRHFNKLSIACRTALLNQIQLGKDCASVNNFLRTKTASNGNKISIDKLNFTTCAIFNQNTTILNENDSSVKDSPDNMEKVSEIQVNPFDSRDYFEVEKLFTIKDLFNARVHLGHTVRSLTPQMKPFIFGTRFDTCIFDLDETALLLKQALNFMAHIAYRGGIILFVARQPQMVHMVERTAVECGEYAQCRQWDTMAFTAPVTTFGGEIRMPDLVVLLHTKLGTQYTDHQAIIDAAKLGIPTVAVVDSDCNPNIISYPIPGNDDTLDSTQLYLHLFKQAILIGKKKRSEESN